MRVLWPWFLPMLLVVPAILAAYIWILRRKRRMAVRYSSVSLIREALPSRSRWRRHVPFALFLSALASLSVALARPVAEIEVPLDRTTIILALDVSRSMCATDVDPNRLTVAQDAALAFIDELTGGTQLGIVAFSDFAQIIVPPTRHKEALREAIESLTTSIGTAVGSATLKSIDAIAETNPEVAPSSVNLGVIEGQDPSAEEGFQPDIIVLLTDGANTRGPRPIDAAQQAADRRLRVFTIGFGTTVPGPMVCTPAQLGVDVLGGGGFGFGGGGGLGGGFGGGGGGRFRRFLLLDEPTLQGVADLTGGTYYRAENAEQLLEVFLSLPSQISLQKQEAELSFAFSAASAVLVLLALGLSYVWNRAP